MESNSNSQSLKDTSAYPILILVDGEYKVITCFDNLPYGGFVLVKTRITIK